MGGVGNGPFDVVLGQRETDEYYSGGEIQLTGPNEAAWYSASMTTNYDCTATDFSDNFADDSALSGCWQDPELDPSTEGTTAVGAIASNNGSATGPPNLTFSAGTQGTGNGYMQMSGTGGDNDMVMIQSTNAYTAPFQFDTTVAGQIANLEPIGIYLVNTGTRQAFSSRATSTRTVPPPSQASGSRVRLLRVQRHRAGLDGNPGPHAQHAGDRRRVRHLDVGRRVRQRHRFYRRRHTRVGRQRRDWAVLRRARRASRGADLRQSRTDRLVFGEPHPARDSRNFALDDVVDSERDRVRARQRPSDDERRRLVRIRLGRRRLHPAHSIPLTRSGSPRRRSLDPASLDTAPFDRGARLGHRHRRRPGGAVEHACCRTYRSTYPDGCTGSSLHGLGGRPRRLAVRRRAPRIGDARPTLLTRIRIDGNLAGDNFETLDLGDLDLSSSPLGSIP